MSADEAKRDGKREEEVVPRRKLLLAVPGLGLGAAAVGCKSSGPAPEKSESAVAAVATPKTKPDAVEASAILDLVSLDTTPWKTFDPFLFCVHHLDGYPAGNDVMGPAASLAGRNMGSDFSSKDGWSMYHGQQVPGFPRHPHRGFETVTISRRGLIDHSDSLGATARYGNGDVQWMTAGKGIVHAEMFPLLHRDQPNPAELFQIWINLPAANKFAEPHFSMFWNEMIPRRTFENADGATTQVTIIAGAVDAAVAPKPPPHSWAAQPGADVAIWSLVMSPGATWKLPPADPASNRTLYYFEGDSLRVGGRAVEPGVAVRVRPDVALTLEAGSAKTEVLLLQGKPIGEPVVKHGPFVMNSRQEINQAISDYRSTGFGGWPWSDPAPVHARTDGRFAIHADGRKERAG